MPIGVLMNVAAVVLGGILGNFLGPRLSEDFKEKLTTVFGSCALLMGVISITFMKNLPAVVFAVIAGTIVAWGSTWGTGSSTDPGTWKTDQPGAARFHRGQPDPPGRI